METYWCPSLIALWPWKLRKPAGLPIALTEATKLLRLQALWSAQAVAACTRTSTLCPQMMLPGFCGSGKGSYCEAVSMNWSWRAEQAYSHQNRLRLIAQISHPPPCSPKMPSICLKFFSVASSLQRLQHPSRPGAMQSLQADSTPTSKGSESTWKGIQFSSMLYLQRQRATESTAKKERQKADALLENMLTQNYLIILLIILNIIDHQSIDFGFKGSKLKEYEDPLRHRQTAILVIIDPYNDSQKRAFSQIAERHALLISKKLSCEYSEDELAMIMDGINQ